jgi:hypothetical protein
MTRCQTAHAATFALVFGAVVAGLACGDTEYISVERPGDPLRPVGEACTVDSQCEEGRCVGGVCADGACQNDQDCRVDEICVFGQCENADDFACQTDQRPIMTVAPSSLSFEQVALGSSAEQTVTLGNVGDCLLTLQVISFSQNASPDLSCSPCSAEFFPQRIPPGRTLDVIVTYAPTRPGEAAGDLLIRGDDRTAGADGLVTVPVDATYDGIPALVVSPLALSYGFVPFTAGGGAGSRTETVTITNQGTGSAVLELERLFLDREQAFTISAVRQGSEPVSLDAVDPDNPLLIPPFSANNPLAVVEVDVTFTPTDNRDFTDELVIRPGGIADDQRVTVELSGSSLGPPQIEVTAQRLEYGSIGTGAKLVGSVDFQQVTVRNNGQSELVITPAIGGGTAASNFTVMPAFVPPISPGGAVILSVFFSPTSPSDTGNTFAPQRAFEAALNITSNDTDPGSDVLRTVALVGWARSSEQDQILTVEMEFQNADNSWAGSDFRNVDLAIDNLENALVCSKPVIVSQGGVTSISRDLCDEWNEFTSLEVAQGRSGLGQTSWIGLGAFEEPERVVVRGLGPTGGQGKRFGIRVDYIEDCANIPSGLLSSILGIGTSVLLSYLGGSIGVPIAVPPEQIAETIASNCFDREGSTVTTRISLNGSVVASPQTRLNRKGDSRTVATLKRDAGAFCSCTAGVGGPDLQCQSGCQ